MDGLIQEKVKKFEEFVDRRLKPDLVHAIAERYIFIPMLLVNYTLHSLQPEAASRESFAHHQFEQFYKFNNSLDGWLKNHVVQIV